MFLIVLASWAALSFKTCEKATVEYANSADVETFCKIGVDSLIMGNRDATEGSAAELKQKDFKQKNTVYIIKQDYKLVENVTIPDNCILKFEGGSIRGPFTLTGNNTVIEAGMYRLFGTDLTFAGNWNVYSWNICWFGASVNSNDNSPYIKKALDVVYSLGTDITDGYGFNDCGVFVPSGKYKVASRIEVNCRFNLYGNGTSSVIYSVCPDNLFVINGLRGTVSINNVNFICDDGVRSTCNCITLNTEQGTALGRITNCDFSNFNVALNLNTPYWTKITSCNFVYSNEYAIRAKNANSFSLLNCNFRGLGGSCPPASHVYFTGDMQGVCITGCDFSGAYRTSIKLEQAKGYGVQITGNYFEPGYKSVFLGGLLEADNCNITDLLFRANAAYESKAFDIYENNKPRYFIMLRNSWIYRSDIVGNVIVDGTINGNSNSLIGRIYKYTDFQKGNHNLIDSYLSQIERTKRSKTTVSLNTETKKLSQFGDDIQKRMNDKSIISNSIADRKNNISVVFSRLVDVENNVEYSNGVSSTRVLRSGTYAKRPSPAEIYEGFQYFNTDTHKTITWADGKWWNPDGSEAKR